MKALIVYESMFGNTEQIARAVAAGLEESVDVQVAEVTAAPTEPDPDVALIVAGGPTHAFSMSRANTRADAMTEVMLSYERAWDLACQLVLDGESGRPARRAAISKGAQEGEREFGLVSGWRRCHLGNTPRGWPRSTPSSKACTTCRGSRHGHVRHQGRKHAPPAGVSRQRRRQGRPPPWIRVRGESRELLRPTTSAVRFSTVRLTEHGLGVGSSLPRSRKLPVDLVDRLLAESGSNRQSGRRSQPRCAGCH